MRTGREDAGGSRASDEEHYANNDGDDTPPPPLPPRPLPGPQPSHEPHTAAAADRPALQSKPTTAVSSMNIQTLSFPDGTRGTFTSGGDDPSTKGSENVMIPADLASTRGPHAGPDELDDDMSVATFAPTLRPPWRLGESACWGSQSATVQPFETMKLDEDETLSEFPKEFDAIPDESEKDWSDWDRLVVWKSKLKHYMILSSAGKPIYSRHGDLALINSSMGVVQTIISFYEGAKNPLLGFTAGNTRFVIATRGPLYFVAISKLGESDTQLRAQLDALYMQILSTLTLPTLTHIFANRPSTDLRKPLEGTESLLSSLADSFTKGSPSALLGGFGMLEDS
ncbi:Vacuolar fusion protein MON1 [Apiospora rasikravindrae]|uniref:Vacuolar fusion protein MON1 n=1 Tax=Apiospora rasikravindrae TaxID=990691 RepID=A0ABR1UDG6_9PEZI